MARRAAGPGWPQGSEESRGLYGSALDRVEAELRGLPEPATAYPVQSLADALLFDFAHTQMLCGVTQAELGPRLASPPYRLPKGVLARCPHDLLAQVMLRFYRRGVREALRAATEAGPCGRWAEGWRATGGTPQRALAEAAAATEPLRAGRLLAVLWTYGAEVAGGPGSPLLESGPWARAVARLRTHTLPRLLAFAFTKVVEGRSMQLQREDPAVGEIFDDALFAAAEASEALCAAQVRARAAEEAVAVLRAELEALRQEREQREPARLPLLGRRLEVFGDPGHAADYLALLRALGAEAHVWDAFAIPDRFAHIGHCRQVDAFIVCTASCPHELWGVLPEDVPRFTVPVAGLGAFRQVLRQRVLPALAQGASHGDG